MQQKKVKIPFSSLESIMGEIEEYKSISSMHIENSSKKYGGRSWDETEMPLLCNLYGCLSTLDKFILEAEMEETGQYIILDAMEFDVVSALLKEAQTMVQNLRGHGLSMSVN